MKIREERKQQIKQKYRLDYIAKEIGVSHQFISYLFNNKRGCSKKTAQKIIDIIDKGAKIEDYFENSR